VNGPDPAACRGPDDLGKVEHDAETDIFYECSFDARHGTYVWAIVPPVEE
jgi:hypothetical protein